MGVITNDGSLECMILYNVLCTYMLEKQCTVNHVIISGLYVLAVVQVDSCIYVGI